MFMSVKEHKDIYGAFAASIVADPPEQQSEESLDPRVVKGCELLDREHPGWASKINLETFDLADGQRCVIGQVFGGYEHINDLLSLPDGEGYDWEAEESHGFCLYDENDRENEWNRLERDWKIAIFARQANA